MSDALALRSNNPVLAWGTAGAVVALALGGFTLSFSALQDLADASGIPRSLAFVWPLIVDGFIVVATAASFALKSRGPRVTWYPWSALVMFSAISVIGNSLHAVDMSDQLRVPLYVAAVVSAVPAIALLLASHLLVLMIGGAPAKVRRPAPTKAKQTAREIPTVVATVTTPSFTAIGERQEPSDRGEDSQIDKKARLAALVAQEATTGRITGSKAAASIDVPLSTAKRWLAQIRDDLSQQSGVGAS